MLACYAPTAVLAGVPLLVCLDESGHQQIEWRTTATGHAVAAGHAEHDDEARDDEAGVDAENLHSHKSGCVDRDFASNSTFLSRSLTSSSSLFPDLDSDQTDPSIGVIASHLVISKFACSDAVRHEFSLLSFQRLQLKTVVLRI